MGEIKSTLDLVMERTRHLTLSQEEKAEQKHLEFRKHLQGLIQKFQDKTLKMGRVERQLDALEKEHGVTEKDIFLNEVTERLSLEQDNQPLFQLLEEICGKSTKAFVSVLDEYQDAVRAMSAEKYQEAEAQLADKYSISGTAVVPNLDAYQEWLMQVRAIRNQFHGMIIREKSALARA